MHTDPHTHTHTRTYVILLPQISFFLSRDIVRISSVKAALRASPPIDKFSRSAHPPCHTSPPPPPKQIRLTALKEEEKLSFVIMKDRPSPSRNVEHHRAPFITRDDAPTTDSRNENAPIDKTRDLVRENNLFTYLRVSSRACVCTTVSTGWRARARARVCSR